MFSTCPSSSICEYDILKKRMNRFRCTLVHWSLGLGDETINFERQEVTVQGHAEVSFGGLAKASFLSDPLRSCITV